MNAVIYYFTGTGNSLKIARDLSRELDQAEVISIPDVMDADEVNPRASVIGLVYPVYMFGMPVIVSRFIEKLVVRNDPYVFAVANYAGVAGGAISQTQRELGKRGIRLRAAFGIKMPSSYTPFGGALPEGKIKALFEKEAVRVKEIARMVSAGGTFPPEKPFFLTDLAGRALFSLLRSRVNTMDREFMVDDSCSSCSLCEKICPASNIKIEEGRPVWMSKCIQCYACLQWCPNEAIQAVKGTRGRKRYRNPEVKAGDIIPSRNSLKT